MGLPPRSANPSSTPQPFKYDEAIAFPGSSPKHPETPQTNPPEQRNLTAIGNQALTNTTETTHVGGVGVPVEETFRTVQRKGLNAERVRRQMYLYRLLEPGEFTLQTMVVGKEISVWAKTKAGAEEEVTDRFFPQPDENGVMQPPASIIRRRPENEGGDWSFAVRDLVVGGSDGGVRVLVERNDTPLKTRSNFTLEALTQPHPEDPSKYWDLRPPIPFVELSRMTGPVTEPPAHPPRPTV
jgi:hypothetical protein